MANRTAADRWGRRRSDLLRKSINQGIEFGNPLNPNDDQDTTLAGAGTPTTHNGTLEHIRGSWVEVLVDTAPGLGADITFTHNLDIPVTGTNEPNVRWILMGWSHDGTGDSGVSTVSVGYIQGSTITADAIDLQVFANGRTVSDAAPLKISLFFIPAVRMP